MNILAIIPARAGSKGIPRKNVRLLNGKPLVSYSIENAVNSEYITHVAVSTDDIEVKTIAQKYDTYVIDRPAELCGDSVTLDSVIYHAVEKMKAEAGIVFDIVITMQPTSPLLTVDVLDNAIKNHIETNMDTTISGVNEPHLAWSECNGEVYPLYEKRLNRQYLPKHLKETGAFVITKGEFVKPTGRFGNKISIFETPAKQSIDIDTWQDWVLTEAQMKRKNILFRIDGYSEIGTGHIYRSLLLAYSLTEHNIIFCLTPKSDIGIEKIKNSFFKYYVIDDNNGVFDIIEKENVDIVVNDILDTDAEYIKALKKHNVRVVNFEDIGSGSIEADAVINALYEKRDSAANAYYGSDYYCLRDEFIISEKKQFCESVKNVLVLFGGTDPCNLTEKVFEAVSELDDNSITFTFILGLGYKNHESLTNKCSSFDNISIVRDVKNMAEYMYNADIAISSQGRTMFELAAMHVPTIIISQNEREASHVFGDISNGFINLGSGKDVDPYTICSTLKWLISTPVLRRNLYDKMAKIDLVHGISRVKNIILDKEDY